jgi:hypothetical protein
MKMPNRQSIRLNYMLGIESRCSPKESRNCNSDVRHCGGVMRIRVTMQRGEISPLGQPSKLGRKMRKLKSVLLAGLRNSEMDKLQD